jgi:hypothetical protein
MLQGSVHNSWKLKIAQFFNGLHTHQTLSKFWMLWIDVYDSMLQFLPIYSNFAYPLKSGTIFHRPQSHQILTGYLIHTPTFLKISVTNRCISVFPVM